MIPAMVSEFQLKGFASESDAGDLMAQADSKNWLPSHQAPYIVNRVRARLRIARSIRQKHAVGLQGQHVFRRSLCWNYRYLAAFPAQLAQNILLDAEVISDYVEARRLVFYSDNFVRQVRAFARLPHVGMVGRDYFG